MHASDETIIINMRFFALAALAIVAAAITIVDEANDMNAEDGELAELDEEAEADLVAGLVSRSRWRGCHRQYDNSYEVEDVLD